MLFYAVLSHETRLLTNIRVTHVSNPLRCSGRIENRPIALAGARRDGWKGGGITSRSAHVGEVAMVMCGLLILYVLRSTGMEVVEAPAVTSVQGGPAPAKTFT